jgi:hypothetical protein
MLNGGQPPKNYIKMICKVLVGLLLLSTGVAAQQEVCVGEPFYLYESSDPVTGSSSTFDITGGSADYELPFGHVFGGGEDSTMIIITTPGTLWYTRIVLVNEDGKSTLGAYDQMVVATSCDTPIDTAVIDTAIVGPKKKAKFWVPNAFSPNGDTINAFIYPISEESILIEEMMVFDRWGSEVWSRSGFYTNDEFSGWDGANYPPAVYIWVITTDGLTYFGDITLIK